MNDLDVKEITEKASISGGQHGKLIKTQRTKIAIKTETPADTYRIHTWNQEE